MFCVSNRYATVAQDDCRRRVVDNDGVDGIDGVDGVIVVVVVAVVVTASQEEDSIRYTVYGIMMAETWPAICMYFNHFSSRLPCCHFAIPESRSYD